MNSKVKGYMLAAGAACAYGMNPLFALPLYSAGIGVDSVLLWRYLLAVPVIGALMLARGRRFGRPRGEWAGLAVMGLLMAFSSLALFLSYCYIDAGIASTILFVYPLMVAVIMALFYHERLSAVTSLSIAVALAGIGLLYRGAPGGASLNLTGTLLSVGSALLYAVYIVAVNQSRMSRVPTLTLTFYVLLVGAAVFAVRAVMAGPVEMPPLSRPLLWACVIGLAVLPTAVSFLCTTAAIQYIGSTPTAILGALEPVTAVFIGVVVFGETLGPRDIAGMIMILAAVTVVVASPRLGRQLARIKRLFPRRRRD